MPSNSSQKPKYVLSLFRSLISTLTCSVIIITNPKSFLCNLLHFVLYQTLPPVPIYILPLVTFIKIYFLISFFFAHFSISLSHLTSYISYSNGHLSNSIILFPPDTVSIKSLSPFSWNSSLSSLTSFFYIHKNSINQTLLHSYICNILQYLTFSFSLLTDFLLL